MLRRMADWGDRSRPGCSSSVTRHRRLFRQEGARRLAAGLRYDTVALLRPGVGVSPANPVDLAAAGLPIVRCRTCTCAATDGGRGGMWRWGVAFRRTRSTPKGSPAVEVNPSRQA